MRRDYVCDDYKQFHCSDSLLTPRVHRPYSLFRQVPYHAGDAADDFADAWWVLSLVAPLTNILDMQVMIDDVDYYAAP